MNEDYVLDYDITLEEVEAAVRSLRNGKGCGSDGVFAEHMKYGGPTIPVWLKRIFNAVLTLEEIPSSLNNGLVTPIYKGKGRDPLNPNSYRGITVTSVIAKCMLGKDYSWKVDTCSGRKGVSTSLSFSLY